MHTPLYGVLLKPYPGRAARARKRIYLAALLYALVLCLVAGSAAPAFAAPTHAPSAAAPLRPYAYAMVTSTTNYDIMLADGVNKDRRIASVKVDSVFFGDVTAKLSADGSVAAFRVTGDRLGGSSLHVVDVKSGKHTQVAASKNTSEGIGTYVWSPAGNTLAFVRSAPALDPTLMEDVYGTVYVFSVGFQAAKLKGTTASDRVLTFSGDGLGVYVSRREVSGDTTLEHLIYLPTAGGAPSVLLRSQPGLRYSKFAVWSPPGAPAKVACIAEGSFALAAPPPPPTPTEAPPTPTLAITPTAEIAPTDVVSATATADPNDLLSPGGEDPGPEVGPEDPATATSEPQTGAEDPATATPVVEAASPTATPRASKVPITGKLARPNGLGLVLSDPAGTWPVLLRRDAEAYPHLSWSADGSGLLMGGTRSGGTWAVDMEGNKRTVDASLFGMAIKTWSPDGSLAVLSDTPSSRLVSLNYASGNVVGTRNVGVVPKASAPVTRLPVPYVHQVNDIQGNGDGNWACGPTSVVMSLAFYGKLDPWPVYSAQSLNEAGASPVPVPTAGPVSGVDFAPYVTNQYTNNGRTYSAAARDPRGNMLSGLYGTICPTGLASWQSMVSVLESHGLGSTYVGATWDGVTAALKRGHPVIMGTQLTADGHIIVAVGYTADGNLIINDPYGNRFLPGYGGNDGRGVVYPWKRITARRALEVIGAYPPPPRPTSTSVPTSTATAVPETATSTPAPTDTPVALTETPSPLPVITSPTVEASLTPTESAPTPLPVEDTPTSAVETPVPVEPTPVPTMEENTPGPIESTPIPFPIEFPTPTPIVDGSLTLYHGRA
jgi:hypothetical protein